MHFRHHGFFGSGTFGSCFGALGIPELWRFKQSVQIIHSVAAEVGWLLPFSFQFFSRLAAVFAEEVGGFGFLSFNFSLRAFPHDH